MIMKMLEQIDPDNQQVKHYQIQRNPVNPEPVLYRIGATAK